MPRPRPHDAGRRWRHEDRPGSAGAVALTVVSTRSALRRYFLAPEEVNHPCARESAADERSPTQGLDSGGFYGVASNGWRYAVAEYEQRTDEGPDHAIVIQCRRDTEQQRPKEKRTRRTERA